MEKFKHPKLRPPEPVKFVLAATYRQPELLDEALKTICSHYGDVELRSHPFSFNHTRYYEAEMGPDLTKQFLCFAPLGCKTALVDFKWLAMALEDRFSRDARRRINLDPAYLELAKLVVASHKNFAHRIYLGRGVYGDVQLCFRQGDFHPNAWTYADYQSEPVLSFLSHVRERYQKQLTE